MIVAVVSWASSCPKAPRMLLKAGICDYYVMCLCPINQCCHVWLIRSVRFSCDVFKSIHNTEWRGRGVGGGGHWHNKLTKWQCCIQPVFLLSQISVQDHIHQWNLHFYLLPNLLLLRGFHIVLKVSVKIITFFFCAMCSLCTYRT